MKFFLIMFLFLSFQVSADEKTENLDYIWNSFINKSSSDFIKGTKESIFVKEIQNYCSKKLNIHENYNFNDLSKISDNGLVLACSWPLFLKSLNEIYEQNLKDDLNLVKVFTFHFKRDKSDQDFIQKNLNIIYLMEGLSNSLRSLIDELNSLGWLDYWFSVVEKNEKLLNDQSDPIFNILLLQAKFLSIGQLDFFYKLYQFSKFNKEYESELKYHWLRLSHVAQNRADVKYILKEKINSLRSLFKREFIFIDLIKSLQNISIPGMLNFSLDFLSNERQNILKFYLQDIFNFTNSSKLFNFQVNLPYLKSRCLEIEYISTHYFENTLSENLKKECNESLRGDYHLHFAIVLSYDKPSRPLSYENFIEKPNANDKYLSFFWKFIGTYRVTILRELTKHKLLTSKSNNPNLNDGLIEGLVALDDLTHISGNLETSKIVYSRKEYNILIKKFSDKLGDFL